MSASTGNSLAQDVRNVAAGVVDPSSTSNTKWNPIKDLVAEALHVDPGVVFMSTVGGLSRNVGVRLTQSDPARAAKVGMIMWVPKPPGPDFEPLEKAVNKAVDATAKHPRINLIFTDLGTGPELVAIVKPSAAAVPGVLAAAWPTASVINV